MFKAIHFDRENLGQLFSKKFFIVILISIPSAIIADILNIPLAASSLKNQIKGFDK